MMTTTRTATTTREILFSDESDTRNLRWFPAGTEVYVMRTYLSGLLIVRVPGSLWTQEVYLSAIEPC
jgi:hypothetical protein